MKFINTFILVLILNILTAVTINIPADYSTIQEGINAANDGDIVIVSQGTYFENLIINKEITLKSNIAINELELDWYNNTIIKETVINGSIVNDPKKRSCLVIRDGDIQPTIQGLTFEGGVGTSMLVGEGCLSGLSERAGGGILIYDAYPTINYNRFINNGISSENERQLNLESFKTKSFLDKNINAEILGPVNAPIYRIRKKMREEGKAPDMVVQSPTMRMQRLNLMKTETLACPMTDRAELLLQQ